MSGIKIKFKISREKRYFFSQTLISEQIILKGWR